MKEIRRNPVPYTYDPAHKRTPYTIDGSKWMNAGELKEAVAKALCGLDPHKDGNTSFDAGSDIPELNASVKSSKATLTCKPLAGTCYAEMLDDYFSRVASSAFWWVELNDEMVTIYKMSAKTFRRFMERFAKPTSYGPIRFAKTSAKMLAWLDANA